VPIQKRLFSAIKMKKNTVITILAFGAVLIILVVISCEKPEDRFQTKRDAEARDLGRLLRDVGFLQQIGIKPSVDFTLMDLEGKKVSLSDHRDKLVFLNFWATWCPPCRLEMPSMEKLHSRLKKKGFVMVAVDLQEPATQVKKFFKKHRLTFTALLDLTGEVGTRFGISTIPTTFILDREGRITAKALGPREWDSKKAIALFEHLIDKGVDTASRGEVRRVYLPELRIDVQ